MDGADSSATPILLLGAGRMGGALIAGWRSANAFAATDLIVRDPVPGDLPSGIAVNPPDTDLARARTVLLAVKPQLWREAAAQTAHLLAPDAVIVSIVAGVAAADITAAFGGRRTARVMPTTAVAIGQGAASIFAEDPVAAGRALALFEPVAAVARLSDEALMHAATGVSGSAPAYLYALIEALEAAAVAEGLDPADAARLVRATLTGAAALLAASDEDPAELRRQVTSPGGTTAAALAVLQGEGGLPDLMARAVAAAIARSQALAAS